VAKALAVLPPADISTVPAVAQLFRLGGPALIDSFFGPARTLPAAAGLQHCVRAVGMRRSELQRPVSSRRVGRFTAGVVAVAIALPLAGCFVTDQLIPAALDIPRAYRAGPRHADAALPSVVWWRGFRSIELSALIEEALTSNFDIAIAVARIVQADAQSRVAGAPLLPAVDFTANDSHSQSSRTTGSGSSGGSSVRNSYSIALNASYEVDFWGKNRAAMRAAEQTAVASRFDREVVALTTIVSVANTYFEVLAAYDRLRIARDNIAAATRVYNLIKQRFDVGTASALDLAQQESVLNTQRAAVPPLQQILRQDVATLAVLVGRPPERIVIRAGSMSRIRIPRVTPGLPSDLLTQRPDIREAEAQLASANASVQSARAAFFPSIQLTADGGYMSAALRTLLRPESTFYNLAAGLTQPLLDGARLQGLFDFQKGRQDELLQTYRKAVINGFADVERALIALRQTAEREHLQRQVVSSTRRAFEIAEARLREGTVDLITVLNTQQALFQAQDSLAQARLDRLRAVVGLYQALGGGWQKPPKQARRRH
jgi:multidrug efflux system outer membrane protein